jgi:hypothetical protein
MVDQNKIDFGDINARWPGDKPNRWIRLSHVVLRVAITLDTSQTVAGALLLSEAIPPVVPWAVHSKLPEPEPGDEDDWKKPTEIPPSLLIHASFDFRQGVLWINDGSFDLEDIYLEQNRLDAWLERKRLAQADQHVPSSLLRQMEKTLHSMREQMAPAAQPGPSVPANGDLGPKNKGGAPRKFDKEAFMRQALRLLAQPDGIRPKNRQELTAQMAEWWLETWGEEAKPSTLRGLMAEVYAPPDD